MADYDRRIIDDDLDELFPGLPAVAIEGPKAVGKTATALQRCRTVYRMDDPSTVEIIRGDPQRLAVGEPPILIDEWQRFPSSWDVVRRAVDDGPRPGRFLLTGSATPTDAPAHSGAGRIVTMRMRPLSLAERGVSGPTVSLRGLFTGDRATLEGRCDLSLTDYAREIVASGFPAIRTSVGRSQRAQLDGYLHRIAERDVPEAGIAVRNRDALRRWLTAYAAATSTTATYEVIRDAASPGEADKPSKPTAVAYRSVLEQLWIVEPVPAWLPVHNHLRRLASAPVHQLADPALAARLLGVSVDGLLRNAPAGAVVPRDGALLGALFQSLATLSVRVYAERCEARVFHLRTRGGEQEIDLILERHDGRVVAIEVKLAQAVTDADVRHLRWLQDRLGDDLADAIVLHTGPEAYRRRDGIAVIPLGLLGP
ncbi:MAG: ATP-binding protein [Acidimicrobiia bacterium]